MGHSVEVLTQYPSYPQSYVYAAYVNKGYTVEDWDGIKIHRFPVVEGYKEGLIKKLHNYFRSVRKGGKIAKKIDKKQEKIQEIWRKIKKKFKKNNKKLKEQLEKVIEKNASIGVHCPRKTDILSESDIYKKVIDEGIYAKGGERTYHGLTSTFTMCGQNGLDFNFDRLYNWNFGNIENKDN